MSPAVSEQQRKYLNVHFGHKWVKRHGFDNRGKLPRYAKRKPMAKPNAHKHAAKGSSVIADAIGRRKTVDEKKQKQRHGKIAMFVKAMR